MTGTRRALILIGLTLAVVIGGTIPASATFVDSASVATTTISTLTVQAPTNVKGIATCVNGTMTARLTWTPSTTDRVSQYIITAQTGGLMNIPPIPVPGTQSSFEYSIGAANATHHIPVTITTVTDYGWTKAAAPVTVTTC